MMTITYRDIPIQLQRDTHVLPDISRSPCYRTVTNSYLVSYLWDAFALCTDPRVVSACFPLVFTKSKKHVRNFTLSRTHCNRCVIHDGNLHGSSSPGFPAAGYNFLYTRRNDYLAPSFLSVSLLPSDPDTPFYQEAITLTFMLLWS